MLLATLGCEKKEATVPIKREFKIGEIVAIRASEQKACVLDISSTTLPYKLRYSTYDGYVTGWFEEFELEHTQKEIEVWIDPDKVEKE